MECPLDMLKITELVCFSNIVLKRVGMHLSENKLVLVCREVALGLANVCVLFYFGYEKF